MVLLWLPPSGRVTPNAGDATGQETIATNAQLTENVIQSQRTISDHATPISILSVKIVTEIYVNLSRKVCTLDSNLNQEVAHS